jgi:Uma2 family endonuclease
MTWLEYVAWERNQPTKHEYVAGEVFAMSGVSAAHSRMAANIIAALTNAMRGRGCRAYTSDMRVRTPLDRGFYPDVSASCGKAVGEEELDHTTPSTIVEVLSPNTEAFDRGEKFAHYRAIPSLQEYVLTSSTQPLVEVFTREGDHWALRTYAPGAHVHLASIDCTLAVDDVYDKVFTPG